MQGIRLHPLIIGAKRIWRCCDKKCPYGGVSTCADAGEVSVLQVLREFGDGNVQVPTIQPTNCFYFSEYNHCPFGCRCEFASFHDFHWDKKPVAERVLKGIWIRQDVSTGNQFFPFDVSGIQPHDVARVGKFCLEVLTA
eukprot:PhF_6_TR4419/c0_g1_i1/m.5972